MRAPKPNHIQDLRVGDVGRAAIDRYLLAAAPTAANPPRGRAAVD